MNEIRTEFVVPKLDAVHDRVYHRKAPSTAQYPYIVFKLPNSDENEHTEDFLLEVEVWDENDDATPTETLAGAVKSALDRQKYVGDKITVISDFRGRISPPDPNPKMQRRLLRFTLKTYQY